MSEFLGDRVSIRFPQERDANEFISAAKASIEWFSGFVNPPKDVDSFTEYIRRCEGDGFVSFLVIENASGAIAGVINISQIFMKAFRSAYLGYYVFEGFQEKGLMFEGMSHVMRYAFANIGLHRLEANIQPENIRSLKFVKRFGFTREGFSRKYLMIDGEWRDHERWAILKEDFYG